MPSDSTSARSPRTFGPVRLLDASLGRQLLGFVLAVVGVQIVGWAADSATALPSAVVYGAVGAFAVLNGLYLGGVRPR